MRTLLAYTLRRFRLLAFDLLSSSSERHPVDAELSQGKLLVVESDGHQKWACLRCPGGCGLRIDLSLNPRRRPRWTLVRDWFGRPTVKPSVHQLNSCGCHFWIVEVNIEWCQGGRPPARKLP